MTTAIDYNSRVQMTLDGSRAEFTFARSKYALRTNKSALQRPDLRRAELAALLRMALKNARSKKETRTYWAGFMASHIAHVANSNQAEQSAIS